MRRALPLNASEKKPLVEPAVVAVVVVVAVAQIQASTGKFVPYIVAFAFEYLRRKSPGLLLAP